MVAHIVIEDLQQPEVKLDYVDDYATPARSAGEYEGFDRFGRVRAQTWYRHKTGQTAIRDKFTYGYDANSNRKWRENTIRHSAGGDPKLDEYYTYDNLNRLTNMVCLPKTQSVHDRLGILGRTHASERYFRWSNDADGLTCRRDWHEINQMRRPLALKFKHSSIRRSV